MTETVAAPAAAAVKQDTLQIRYIELAKLKKWGNNPKLHNLKEICASLIRYGFKDGPRWEPSLNKGTGGIVAGNGRIEALTLLKMQNFKAPRGIQVRESDGEWLIPIQFGVDAGTEQEAENFGIDHNALTVGGAKLTEEQQLQMWNKDALVDIAHGNEKAEQLPLMLQSFEEQKLAELLKVEEQELEGGSADPVENEPEVADQKGNKSKHVKMYQLFLDTESYPLFVNRMLRLRSIYGTESGTDTVAEALLRQVGKNEGIEVEAPADGAPTLTGTEVVMEAVRRESEDYPDVNVEPQVGSEETPTGFPGEDLPV